MFDVTGVVVLVTLLALFGWLTWRVLKTRRRGLRWAGALLFGLPTLLLMAVALVALVGFYRVNARHTNPVASVTVEGTPAQIERGERFAQVCVGCHSMTGQAPLNGSDFGSDGPPVGTLYAANLTPVHLKDWSDGEIIRAIREGVHRDGRSLLLMPAEHFRGMSDTDVQSIVAYLRSQPVVEPDTPPTRVSVFGALLVNIAPLLTAGPPIDGPVNGPPQGPTAEYGAYLTEITGCASCHGENLQGGSGGFGPPPGPNITGIARGWSEADFIKTMRTGVKPDGRMLGEEMPWQQISAFASDDDLRAMYAYLASLSGVAGATR